MKVYDQGNVGDAADGDLLARVAAIREEKAELAEQEKALNGEMSAIESEILRRMNDRKVDRFAGNGMSAVKTIETQPQVEEWDAVYAFIRESGDFSLLQKRISATAYRELLAMGSVPGIISREVTKVGFRKS